jgi:hypothetical protein
MGELKVDGVVKSTDELRWRVKLKDCRVISYTGTMEDTRYHYEGDSMKPPLYLESDLTVHWTLQNASAKPVEDQRAVIYFDAKTKKIKRVYFAYPSIEVTWQKESVYNLKTREGTWEGDFWIKKHAPEEKTVTEKIVSNFSPHPVEDNVKTPSGGSGWHKDEESSSGDGIRTASGQGKHTVTRESKCVKTTEEETFRWDLNMTIAKR